MEHRLALRRLHARYRDVWLEDVEQDEDHVLREPRARREALADVVQRERRARVVFVREPPGDVLVEGAAHEERGGEQQWLVHEAREVYDVDRVDPVEGYVRGVEQTPKLVRFSARCSRTLPQYS